MSAPKAFSTLAGLGFVSSMPGTLGSAAACLAVIPFCSTAFLLSAIIIAAPLGIWASGRYAREIGAEDPSEVIIDEAVGVWIAMAGHVVSLKSAGFALPALFLFRVFDILKPIPVSTAERLPGGWGIMADDVVAGVMANLMLWLFRWFFQGPGLAAIGG